MNFQRLVLLIESKAIGQRVITVARLRLPNELNARLWLPLEGDISRYPDFDTSNVPLNAFDTKHRK